MRTFLPHTASDFCVQDEQKQLVRKFKSLSPEEIDAAMNAPMDKLEEALERGRQDRIAAERAYRLPSMSNLRFR